MFDVAARGCLQVSECRTWTWLVSPAAGREKKNGTPTNFGQILTSEACFGHCRHLLSMYHHQIITKST